MSAPTDYVPLVRSLYRHHKGGLYKIIAVATLESTNMAVVVYRGAGTRQNWVRPLAEWHDLVQDKDGRLVPRFERVDVPSKPQERPNGVLGARTNLEVIRKPPFGEVAGS